MRSEPLDKISQETASGPSRLKEWRGQALAGMQQTLPSREANDPAQPKLDEAKRRFGELSMESELFCARSR